MRILIAAAVLAALVSYGKFLPAVAGDDPNFGGAAAVVAALSAGAEGGDRTNCPGSVCGPPSDDGDSRQVAKGQECPAASGAYCSDEFPVCCWKEKKGYYCEAKLENC